MKRTIALLTLLGLVGTASASTIANWRFEEGTPGVQHAGDHDNFYADTSGNGNHLSAWNTTGNPTATADLPFASQGVATNLVALDFDLAFSQNIATFGPGDVSDKMIDSYAFTNGWTVEATFKLESFDWQVIVGKDGQRDGGVEAPLWMKVLGPGHTSGHALEVLVVDNSNDFHYVQSTEPLKLDRWYSSATTFDAATGTFSLYLKQQDGGDYVLQDTVTGVTAGVSFENWTNRFWTVGRGMHSGNPIDLFNGIIDEVRISDVALTPSEFINQDGFTIPFDIEMPYGVVADGFIDWSAPFDLSASEYWSPAGEVFAISDWQISTDDAFASLNWAANIGLPTITVPGNTLVDDTYYARVRYLSIGGTTSEWSNAYLLNLHGVQTVAYWRFEELGDGQRHPDYSSDLTDIYLDSSGNGNHLAHWWWESRPTYTDDVPAPTASTGLVNNAAVDFHRFSDLGTFTDGVGTAASKTVNDLGFPNGWTIEASFTVRDWWWESVIAKQGKVGDIPGAITTDWQNLMAPFQFKVCGDSNWSQYGRIACAFSTDAGELHWLWTQDQVQLGKWYSIAATCNGTEVKLYLKTDGDDEYVFQGSISVPDGVTFGFWSGREWVVGRGMFDGNPNDAWNGTVDEVRISDGALPPSKFIHQTDVFGAYDVKTPGNVMVASFQGFDAPIRLVASEFRSPRDYMHASSQWQVSTDGGFATVDWDSGEIDGSNAVDIPAGSLVPAVYYVRVGYKANNGTWAWSDASPVASTTIAHWQFEDGVNGAVLATSADGSGNANTITMSGFGVSSNAVPFATVPLTWQDNTLGLSGGLDDFMYTSGSTMLDTYSFVNGWTIEATFMTDVAGLWRVVLGKDGKATGNDAPPFVFKLRDDNGSVHAAFLDNTGNDEKTIIGPYIVPGAWYSVAATYDPVSAAYRFYVKGPADSEYVLQWTTLNVTLGADFSAWSGKQWAVCAGTWAGNTGSDRFEGLVDEVKISNVALQPGGFIADVGAGWDSDDDGMADSWEILYFGSIAACEPGDDTADNDGRDNLSEYRQGGNPTVADLAHPVLTGTVDLGGGTNGFEYVYPRRKYPYNPDVIHRLETTDDLIYPDWVTDDSVVISGIGDIDGEFHAVTNQVPMDTDEKFIKLIIE